MEIRNTPDKTRGRRRSQYAYVYENCLHELLRTKPWPKNWTKKEEAKYNLLSIPSYWRTAIFDSLLDTAPSVRSGWHYSSFYALSPKNSYGNIEIKYRHATMSAGGSLTMALLFLNEFLDERLYRLRQRAFMLNVLRVEAKPALSGLETRYTLEEFVQKALTDKNYQNHYLLRVPEMRHKIGCGIIVLRADEIKNIRNEHRDFLSRPKDFAKIINAIREPDAILPNDPSGVKLYKSQGRRKYIVAFHMLYGRLLLKTAFYKDEKDWEREIEMEVD